MRSSEAIAGHDAVRCCQMGLECGAALRIGFTAAPPGKLFSRGAVTGWKTCNEPRFFPLDGRRYIW